MIGKVVRWLVLVSLIVTTMFAFVYLVDRATVSIQVGMPIFRLVLLFVFLIILTPALWVLLLATGGVIRRYLPSRIRGCIGAVDNFTDYFVRKVASYLLGLEDTIVDYSYEDEVQEDEWHGRMNYIEKNFERIVEQETEDLKSEMQELPARINSKLDNLQKEVSKVQID